MTRPNASGAVQERYAYDAFGKATVYDANWSNPGQTSAVNNTRGTSRGKRWTRPRVYSTPVRDGIIVVWVASSPAIQACLPAAI